MKVNFCAIQIKVANVALSPATSAYFNVAHKNNSESLEFQILQNTSEIMIMCVFNLTSDTTNNYACSD